MCKCTPERRTPICKDCPTEINTETVLKEPSFSKSYVDELRNTNECLQLRVKELEELLDNYKFLLEGHKTLAMPRGERYV